MELFARQSNKQVAGFFADRDKGKARCQHKDSREQNPGDSGADPCAFSFGELPTLFCLALLLTLGAARIEISQPFSEFRGGFQPACGIAAGGIGDVLAQQRVVDGCFPPGRQRAAKIADDRLIEHHAKRINVGCGFRRLPGENFRGEIHHGAGE